MSIQVLHEQLCHLNEDDARKTAKSWGSLKPCEACCAEAKAKQEELPKDNVHEVAIGTKKRVFLDLSTIKKTIKDGKPQVIYNGNWRMLVDERTRLEF
jgi:hypothetical protein